MYINYVAEFDYSSNKISLAPTQYGASLGAKFTHKLTVTEDIAIAVGAVLGLIGLVAVGWKIKQSFSHEAEADAIYAEALNDAK